jgi:uncharacterized protein YqgV (UPF0045/DUF77 family)
MSALEVEFTVEPFVEATIGPHVRAAIDAAEAAGVTVDIGPFSSSFVASVETATTAVRDLLTAAAAAGASRLALQVRVVATGSAT